MKTLLLLLLISNCVFAGAIRISKLDSKKINVVYVSTKDPLTIVMPFDLLENGVTGGDITNDPNKLPASFYINYQSGGKIIDLRALKEKTATHINIINEKMRFM